MANKQKLERLNEYDLDCGMLEPYYNQEPDINDVKITENNITLIVRKINEIIDNLNNRV